MSNPFNTISNWFDGLDWIFVAAFAMLCVVVGTFSKWYVGLIVFGVVVIVFVLLTGFRKHRWHIRKIEDNGQNN